MTRILLVLAILFTGSAAYADDVIAEYSAWLGPEDTRTSSGARLSNFGDVLAQDRANYHRFGIRHEWDTSDPIFDSRDMRGKLPDLYKAGRKVDQYILNDVMSGKGHYVFVRVIGNKGKITHVDVYEGAG